MSNKKDFSKTTIAVLLVLAIVVSVLNTIILINNFSVNKAYTKSENTNHVGSVKLNIVGSDDKAKDNINEQPMQASLKLNIVKNKG